MLHFNLQQEMKFLWAGIQISQTLRKLHSGMELQWDFSGNLENQGLFHWIFACIFTWEDVNPAFVNISRPCSLYNEHFLCI